MKFFGFLLALLFSLPLFACAAEAPYSAVIMDMEGKVLVKHGGKARPAQVGDLLYPADVVETSRGARITVNYVESGQEEQWPENSKFSVGKTQTERKNAGVVVTDRKIEVPELEQGQAGAVTVRSIQRKPEDPGQPQNRTLDQSPLK